MPLTNYDLKTVFYCGVELAEATAKFKPEEFSDIRKEPLAHFTPQGLDVDHHWHQALDEIEEASNRLKRALGAKGPLEAAEHLNDNTAPTWEDFRNQFIYASHSRIIRQALFKLANSAIDLSGYASLRDPDPVMKDRGMRLLGQGLAQLWEGMAGPDREGIRHLLKKSHMSLGWPPDSTQEPTSYSGPEEIELADQYRVIDMTTGFYTRSKDYLKELQRHVAMECQQMKIPKTAGQNPEKTTSAQSPIFTAGDLQRALERLDLVLQDEQWPEGEAKFQQNTFINRLQEHGITRALTLALIDELIMQGVFRAGKTFVDLKILVRLDGSQTDEMQENRYFFTNREKWYGYMANQKSDFTELIRKARESASPEERSALVRQAKEKARKDHYDAEPPPSKPDPVADLRRACILHSRRLDLMEIEPGFMENSFIAPPIRAFYKRMRNLYESKQVNEKPPMEPGLIPTGHYPPELEPARREIRKILDWCDRAVILESTNRTGQLERPKPKTTLKRRKKLEARDKWIYMQCCKGIPYKEIIANLIRISSVKGWQKIITIQGIRTAAIKYAQANDKDPIPNRQNL